MDATSADAVRDTPDAVRDIDRRSTEIKGSESLKFSAILTP